jgi:DNA-binding XRE family transcriptional regulator
VNVKKIELHLDYNAIMQRLNAAKGSCGASEWAKIVGVSMPTVSNIHGKSSRIRPSLEYIIAVARVMKKPIEWYLYGEMPPVQRAAEAASSYTSDRAPADPLADCSPGTRYAVNTLIDILESNDPVVVPALQANLAAFHDSIGRNVEISKLETSVKKLNGEVQNLRELMNPAEPRTGTD